MAHIIWRYRGTFLALLAIVTALTSWATTSEAVCTPLGTTTPNAGLCKPSAGEAGWTNAVNSNWDTLDSRIVPPGAVMFYAGATPPAGWYACDGSAKSRTTDAALFAAIGTTFGAGDGLTTFNILDARSRDIVAAGTGTGLSARTLGATGGEQSHTLSIAEMPAHTHGGFNSAGSTGVSTAGSSSPSGVTGSTGGGGSHNVMDPFLVLTCMIRR